MTNSVATETRNLPSITPNPMWFNGSWINNLVLFFDDITLLVPSYMEERPEETQPAIVAGLKQEGLSQIIEPEKALDKVATEKLAMALTDVITSGLLDELAKEKTAFHELSMSRLGYHGDRKLAKMIFEQLKERGLPKDSEDQGLHTIASQGALIGAGFSLANDLAHDLRNRARKAWKKPSLCA